MLHTFDEAMKSGGLDSWNNYMGDDSMSGWLLVIGRSRDSEILELSNFDAVLKSLGGESDTVRIYRFGHWGCGWIEELMIDPADKKAVQIAEDIRNSLEDYPVLDDEDYYKREYEDACESWDNWAFSDWIQSQDANEATIEYLSDNWGKDDAWQLFIDSSGEYYSESGGTYINTESVKLTRKQIADIVRKLRNSH